MGRGNGFDHVTRSIPILARLRMKRDVPVELVLRNGALGLLNPSVRPREVTRGEREKEVLGETGQMIVGMVEVELLRLLHQLMRAAVPDRGTLHQVSKGQVLGAMMAGVKGGEVMVVGSVGMVWETVEDSENAGGLEKSQSRTRAVSGRAEVVERWREGTMPHLESTAFGRRSSWVLGHLGDGRFDTSA